MDQTPYLLRDIVATVRESFVVLDSKLHVLMANQSFLNLFKVTQKETVDKYIYDLGNKQWDIPELRELLENILPEHTVFDYYEVEHEFVTIGKRIMLLNARKIYGVLGKDGLILLAIEDITE
ncbi:MAG: PAS domain-containing protein, partial [Oligoflexia bacterium]|nr:PAS domain-containing protein [Oligoflexia bacterium]